MLTTNSPTTPDVLCACARATIHHKARRLIGRFGFTDADRDDLEQELTTHLLGAITYFDPAKSKLESYVSCVVERKIVNIIRDRSAIMRDYRRTSRGIDDATSLDQLPEPLIDHQAVRENDQRDLRIDLAAVLDELPDDLRELCLELQSESITAVARRHGMSYRRIYADVHRLREIFARAGLTQYLGRGEFGGSPGR